MRGRRMATVTFAVIPTSEQRRALRSAGVRKEGGYRPPPCPAAFPYLPKISRRSSDQGANSRLGPRWAYVWRFAIPVAILNACQRIPMRASPRGPRLYASDAASYSEVRPLCHRAPLSRPDLHQHSCRTGPLFDPLRQVLVAGSNLAHRLLGLSVVHGFGSSQDLLSACSQVPCER
jgi:hypothetical protein